MLDSLSIPERTCVFVVLLEIVQQKIQMLLSKRKKMGWSLFTEPGLSISAQKPNGNFYSYEIYSYGTLGWVYVDKVVELVVNLC